MADTNPVFTWDANSNQIFDNNYDSQTCSSNKENFFGKNINTTFTLDARDPSTTLTLKPIGSPPPGALWRGLIQLNQGTLQAGLKDSPFGTLNLYPIQNQPANSTQPSVMLINSTLTFWTQNISLRSDMNLKKMFILSVINDSSLSLNQLGSTNSFINYGGLITLEDDANATINVEGKMTVQGSNGGFCVMDAAQLTIQAKSFVFNAPKNTTYNFSLGGPSYSLDKDGQYSAVASSAFIQFNNPDPNDNTSCLFDFVNQTYAPGLFNFVTKNPQNGNDISNRGSFIICGLSGNNLEALKAGKFFAKDGQVLDASEFKITTADPNKVIITLNGNNTGFNWDKNVSQTFDDSYGSQTCSSNEDDFFGKVAGTTFTLNALSDSFYDVLYLHPQNLTNAAWHGKFLLENGALQAGSNASPFGTLDIYSAQNLSANAPWTIIASQDTLLKTHAQNIKLRTDANNGQLIVSATDNSTLQFYQYQSSQGEGSFTNYGSLLTLEDSSSGRIVTDGNMELKADGGGMRVMDNASLTIIAKQFLSNGYTGYNFSLGGPSYSADPNKRNQYRPVTSNAEIVFGQLGTTCIFDFVNQSYPQGLFNFVTKNPKSGSHIKNEGKFLIYNLPNNDNYKAFLQGNYLAIDGKVIQESDYDNYFWMAFLGQAGHGVIATIFGLQRP